MKRLLPAFLVLITLLILSSCQKNEQTTYKLEGNWKVIATSGGFWGGGYTPKFERIKIDSELGFELLTANEVIVSGHIEEIEHEDFDYLIKLISKNINTNENIYIIDDISQFVEFNGDKIILNSYAYDGYNTEFQRD